MFCSSVIKEHGWTISLWFSSNIYNLQQCRSCGLAGSQESTDHDAFLEWGHAVSNGEKECGEKMIRKAVELGPLVPLHWLARVTSVAYQMHWSLLQHPFKSFVMLHSLFPHLLPFLTFARSLGKTRVLQNHAQPELAFSSVCNSLMRQCRSEVATLLLYFVRGSKNLQWQTILICCDKDWKQFCSVTELTLTRLMQMP